MGAAIAQAKRPPRLWLQSSTATLYAHRYDAPNDEITGVLGGAEPNAPDTWRFSIEVAKAWERAANEAITPRTRKVLLRSAMVMSPDKAGVFDVLLGLVRHGLGGQAGNGKQFISWIHDQDFVRAVLWLIEHEELEGPINLAAPNPLPNAEFMRTLRQAWGAKLGLPTANWMLLGISRLYDAEPLFGKIEKTLQDNPAQDTDAIRGEIAAQRAISQGAYRDPQTLGVARTALALLPSDSPVRPLAYLSMGTAHYNAGELTEAQHIFSQTLAQVAHHRELRAEQVGLRSSLGLVLLAQGHLTDATTYCAEAVALAGNEGEVLPNGASLSQAALGLIALYRNHLDEAEQRLNHALVIAQRYHGVDTELFAASNLALRMRMRGQWQRALTLAEQAQAQTPAPAHLVRNAIYALRASIWLAQGNVAQAAEWAANIDIEFERTRPRMTPLDDDRFIRVSIWMAQAQWDKAQATLTQLQQDAEATGHGVFLLHAHIMLAAVYAAQDNETHALALLDRALALAEPEGFVRVFLDEGAPMQQLLVAYRAQHPLPKQPFADVIWSAFTSSWI